MSKIRWYLCIFATFSSTYQYLGFRFCRGSGVYVLVFCLLGRVRSLSTSLWSLTHLTALHLNDNNLARIPPDIAKLHNLVYLDLSSNKLRSLPAELGNMVSLRWGNISLYTITNLSNKKLMGCYFMVGFLCLWRSKDRNGVKHSAWVGRHLIFLFLWVVASCYKFLLTDLR